MPENKETLVDQAMEGDGDALENLIRSIRDSIYNLSLKMLYQPSDADDATQEILIKITTRLESFRRQSSFETWSYAIASNHLLNKRKKLNRLQYTFRNCEEMIISEAPDQKTLQGTKAEQNLIVEEMRISCMQGLLQCLDWDHRIAYILGETVEVTGEEGALILGITAEAFRKRVSRSRLRLREFLTSNCELYREGNPCKCKDQALIGIKQGYLNPTGLQYADPSRGSEGNQRISEQLNSLENFTREAVMMRYQQKYQASETFIEGLKAMLSSEKINDLKTIH